MDGKRLTIGAGIAAFGTAFGVIFREALGWLVGKVLDRLPLPRSAANAVNWDAIPWLNMLAFALLALGVYLFWRGGRMQSAKSGKPRTREELLRSLYHQGSNIVDRVRHYRRQRWLGGDNGNEIIDTAKDGISLLLTYAKEGLVVPEFTSQDAAEICIGLDMYFSTIGPLMRDGHLPQIQASMGTIAKNAENAALSFNPGDWYVRQY
ncbi:MAG: hypothetical protein ABI898_13500 [Sphingomonadales bacterium]